MKRNILFIIAIGLFLLALLVGAGLVLTAGARADAAAVDAANQLYATGHYAEAAKIYEQEIARGVQDSTLYYNLGNAYFQQGDLGRAVLNMERAAQLNPRDADIQANLALFRAETVEIFAAEPSGPLSLLAGLTGWLTFNETAMLVLGFWFLLGFILLAGRSLDSRNSKMRSMAKFTAVLVVVLLFISGISLASRSFLEQTQPAGIVVAPTVAVSSGPGSNLITDLNLAGGTEVNLIEQQGEWVRLEMPAGAPASWVPVKTVEPVAARTAAAF